MRAAVNCIRDELTQLFTNQEIMAAQSLVRALEECEPLSDHVDELSFSVMSHAIKKADYKLAENAIKSGAKEGAKKICIQVLISAAVSACGKCPDILRDALPQATATRYWGFRGK